MSEETKTRSFRISEEVAERFKQLCEGFDNQNAALDSLITAYEVQSAKAVLVNRQTDISDYDTHLQALQQAFLHSLELNANAEKRIRAEFGNQLASKDKIIEDLQTRTELEEKTAEQARKDIENISSQAAEDVSNAEEKVKAAEIRADNERTARIAAENTANDKVAIVDGLQKRIADLTENLTNSKNEIDKLRKTNDLQQKRLSSAETKNLELETELAAEKTKRLLLWNVRHLKRKKLFLMNEQKVLKKLSNFMLRLMSCETKFNNLQKKNILFRQKRKPPNNTKFFFLKSLFF